MKKLLVKSLSSVNFDKMIVGLCKDPRAQRYGREIYLPYGLHVWSNHGTHTALLGHDRLPGWLKLPYPFAHYSRHTVLPLP